MKHTPDPQLLERPIRILVVGCGGNGSAIASGLPYLHQALLAFGHPGGLAVTLIDPDTVSETNCVRQPFCRTEIGFPKAIVLAHRINLFWGLNWQGMHSTIQQLKKGSEVDFVIGCVDTRKARRAIDKWVLSSRVLYWLDLGNNASSGQFVLGQPNNSTNRKEEASPSDGCRVVPGDPQDRQERRRSALVQRGRSADPPGTIHQPESRLPSVGNADPTAAPWILVLPGRILQFNDRANGPVTHSSGRVEFCAETTTISWP